MLISYACGSYRDGLYGGVPRYVHQLEVTFRGIAVLKYPRDKPKLMQLVLNHPGAVVITDNHTTADVPRHVKCIIVSHGCAAEHVARAPWKKGSLGEMAELQKKVWQTRDPKNTMVVSISAWSSEAINKHSPRYSLFPRVAIYHSSEHSEVPVWVPRGRDTIRVLCNYSTGPSKGQAHIPDLQRRANLEIVSFNVKPTHAGLDDFHRRKQDLYLSCDVFLQLSVSEGSSYASLDALQIGMPVVASNVGLFTDEDIPAGCYRQVDWQASIDDIAAAIEDAHARGAELGAAARAHYLSNYRFCDWQKKMQRLVAKVYRGDFSV